jgi:hypothetical protein
MAFPSLPIPAALRPHRPVPPAPPVIEGTEPDPGSPEALQLLAALGVSADDPRLDADAITRSLQLWLRLRIWLEQLTEEQKAIQEQLRLAHLRGDLRRLLPTTPDGNGYVVAPQQALIRRKGRRQWHYSPACQELDCQLKARQDHEQRTGSASYRLGAGFWELRAIRD